MKAVVFHGIGDIRIDTVPDTRASRARAPRSAAPRPTLARFTDGSAC